MTSLLLLILAACTCHDAADLTEVSEVTTACLTKEGRVRAGFGGCLRTGCDSLLRASCSAHLVDGAVVVQGAATVRHVEGAECARDCKAAVATCEGETLTEVGVPVNATKTPKLARCWDLP